MKSKYNKSSKMSVCLCMCDRFNDDQYSCQCVYSDYECLFDYLFFIIIVVICSFFQYIETFKFYYKTIHSNSDANVSKKNVNF